MLNRHTDAGLTVSWTRVLLLVAYFAIIFPVLMYFNVGLVPDVLIFVMLGAAIVIGHARLFIHDWGAFLLVLILWQQTEKAATWANFPLHMRDLISVDRAISAPFLHGQLLQVWLQQHLYHPGFMVRTHYHAGYWHGHVYHPAWWDHVYHPIKWRWYDILSCVLYGLHFPQPLVVGFVIWARDRALFRRFAAAFLTLAAIAFVIYVVYPAVPPWMASDRTYHGRVFAAIPPLHKIFTEFNYYILTKSFGHQYRYVLNVQYNMTAAMPSLHAALPLLSALYLRKCVGRWGWLMVVYAAAVWFAVVYLAEHWIIDVMAGLVCAVVAYAIVESVARYLAGRRATRPVLPTSVAAMSSDLGATDVAADPRARTEQGWK